MKELIIEPKFRDLIPKLTDEEYAQLEKNILADGRVKEPIVTWNNTIIDGHHRYYIIQKHPEIPFEIEERDFSNEYEAMAWACCQQLGRRNLNSKDKAYLIGKEYESQKLSYGDKNRFKENDYNSPSPRNGHLEQKLGRTNEQIGKEHGVGKSTVERAEKFAKGVDIADNIIPGMKEQLLHSKGNTIHMDLVSILPQATPDTQEKAVEAMSDNNSEKAKKIFKSEGVMTEADKRTRKKETTRVDMTVFEDKEPEPYNADDLLEEIRCAKDMLHKTLKPLFDIHEDILITKDGKKNAIKGLRELDNEVKCFIAKFNK